MVEFKAPNHLMILIPAKMNSPKYDNFIDMFNVPTPISPLPPTPVASPSHEPSLDAIYDSLPPMEQSTVPESPLKEPMEPSRVPKSPLKDPVDSKPPIVSISPDPPVKKAHVKKVDSVIHCSPRSRERRNEERRNEERRNEERSPRDPGCIEDPISDPRIEVHDGPNRCLPRAYFNDRGARDAARETRHIGICRSAGTSPCLHHLPGTQHETSFCDDPLGHTLNTKINLRQRTTKSHFE
ncbi:hypothetical protein TNCV_373351 [Trichonephila clavipes]|nr:hypothetical protein TNCV_373351 [Trichonephila clavipes]